MKALLKYVILVFVFLLIILWIRLEIIRLGYIHQNLLKKRQKKLEEYYRLRLIYAKETSPTFMMEKAKKMGFIKPREKDYRFIKVE